MNLAGKMGKNSPQPSKNKKMGTVDPLERLMQKMAGRSQGRAVAGIKAPSAMNRKRNGY